MPGVLVGLVLAEGDADDVDADGLCDVSVGEALLGEADVGEADVMVGEAEVEDDVGDGEGLHAASASAAADSSRIGVVRRPSMVTTPWCARAGAPLRAYVAGRVEAGSDGRPSGWPTA